MRVVCVYENLLCFTYLWQLSNSCDVVHNIVIEGLLHCTRAFKVSDLTISLQSLFCAWLTHLCVAAVCILPSYLPSPVFASRERRTAGSRRNGASGNAQGIIWLECFWVFCCFSDRKLKQQASQEAKISCRASHCHCSVSWWMRYSVEQPRSVSMSRRRSRTT